MDISQPEATTLVLEYQSLVVNTHQVHGCRLEVMHMDRIFCNVVTDFIGLAMRYARPDAATGHPVSKAARMMITPVRRFACSALTIGSATKLTTPDHQRVLEHTTLLQVGNQCCTCLIGILTLLGQSPDQAAMLVPTTMVKLHETNTPLGQPACQQCISGKFPGDPALRAIEIKD